MAEPVFERITIIGLGLIGGSIAKAVRKNHVADIILGCDSSSGTLNIARSQKIIDIASNDAAQAVRESQLIIIATPPASLEVIAKYIAPNLLRGALVMDTASVKEFVMHNVGSHLPDDVSFVPVHPIAGSEQSGFSASRADLFTKKRVIVTPGEPLEGDVLQKITRFWTAIGARVEGMPPDIHDRIYAYVSHLPQLLAFACKDIFERQAKNETIILFSRLGFSNPALWNEIFTLNAQHILPALDRYIDVVFHVLQELIEGNKIHAAATEKTERPEAALFARIVASCLVSTVMEAEKKSGFAYARYAGSGFNDFIAPSTLPPEPDIEHISKQSSAVISLLRTYIDRLALLRNAIAQTNIKELTRLLPNRG